MFHCLHNKRDCFNWYKEYQKWSENQWYHVHLTGELRFNIWFQTYLHLKRIKSMEFLLNIVKHDHFASADVVVWGGIMINRCMPFSTADLWPTRDTRIRSYKLSKTFQRCTKMWLYLWIIMLICFEEISLTVSMKVKTLCEYGSQKNLWILI